ncbi:isochorismatase family protein [uncultured Erythrobacter sp.]|uniref:isochorismatase family protein n=1 Tax=uncultured Erythrobacter sp. TaxID=263913 RepID=UPI0026276956|nr:isochorismatase family protein [uncultured Erythrobacter sp.]
MIAKLVDRFGRVLTNRHAKGYGPFEARQTAVLVLTPQNDAVIEGGGLAGLCEVPVDRQKLSNFLQHCRDREWAIYHSPMSWSDDQLQILIDSTKHMDALRKNNLLRKGSTGADLAEDLALEGDHVLPERRGFNAFVDTDSSARMAVEYDFYVTVVRDLLAAYRQIDLVNTMIITLPRIVARVVTSQQSAP